jgi:hypothetical protein
MNKIVQLVSIVILMLSINTSINALTFSVNSQTSFNNALTSAGANDTILWQSGTYSNIYMNVSKSNLVIMAEVIGETVFIGSSSVSISGSHVTLMGFQYIGGDIGTSNVITTTGSYNFFTQINIKDYTSYKYLVINSQCQYDTVSYCNFEHRANYADQNILSVLVDATNPGYNTIKYCSFKNFIGNGIGSADDDGVEPIRIGVSYQGEFISRTTVEYCYFTQCNGDGEIISGKSRQNVYRYNTFENNPESELVLRHGDEGVVYGNFFLNGMGGVRIREGQHHAVFNNYFSGLTSRSINLQNDDSDPLDDIIIAYNTFIETDPILLGGSGSYDPTNVVFANNIFTQPTASLFSDATGTEEWIGNIYSGTLGITEPASGLTATDPGLEINSDGYYGLATGSSAINAAESGYPALPNYPDMGIDNEVLLDLMKLARPADITSKDLGCSEYPHTIVIKPIATEDNTGPSYMWPEADKKLVVNLDGMGTVTLDPPSGSYSFGTTVTLTANPSINNIFKEWSGDISGTNNPETIFIDGNKTVTAYFEANDNTGLNTISNQLNISFQVFPNPAINEISLVIYQENGTLVELNLNDISGRKVKTLINQTIPSGEFTFKQDVSDISSGIYLLQLKQTNQLTNKQSTQVIKFIKQ